MLWVDPEWPKKAWKGDDRSILKCSPKCDACLQLVMKGKPAYCPKWSKEKRAVYRELFQQEYNVEIHAFSEPPMR